jgi:actin-related protein
MTPEKRFERIERNLAEMAASSKEARKEHEEWLREMDKRHEEARQRHESWLLDHERWMDDQELIEERSQRWRVEMQLQQAAFNAGQKALQAEQAVTAHKLQEFIDSLRRGGNGHN